MSVYIEATYNITLTTFVDLGDYVWKDVLDYHVKWNTLHVTFFDGVKKEIPLSENLAMESEIDFKRPTYFRATCESGTVGESN